MRLRITIAGLLAGLCLGGSAHAQARVGVAAPLSGPSAILGGQMRDGAALAAEAPGQPPLALTVADDACTAAGGAEAARRFVAEKVAVAVGFLCTESIEAALPILTGAGIPVLTSGVRTDSLTDRRQKTGWRVYRLAPRADAEREAAGRLLTRLWREALFALVDDGTIYGRELSESARIAAEQAGLKPVFVDTFRPQLDNQIALVGRLRRAGATHVFAGGDREDVAILSRDAAASGNGLTVAGGEALRAAGDVPLAPGTLMIAVPEATLPDGALKDAFAGSTVAPEGYVLPTFAAVEIARAALSDGAPGELSGRDFATVLGTIRFDAKGDLAENPYRVLRFDGTGFVAVDVP